MFLSAFCFPRGFVVIFGCLGDWSPKLTNERVEGMRKVRVGSRHEKRSEARHEKVLQGQQWWTHTTILPSLHS